jgi:protein-disulfide isomerase
MMARCLPAERYFGMLDVLFRSQATWSRAPEPQKALAQTARLGGLGEKEFEACMANQDLMNGIVQKRLDGETQFQINSTPTFVVQAGGKQEKIAGNQPLQAFADAIAKVAP